MKDKNIKTEQLKYLRQYFIIFRALNMTQNSEIIKKKINIYY